MMELHNVSQSVAFGTNMLENCMVAGDVASVRRLWVLFPHLAQKKCLHPFVVYMHHPKCYWINVLDSCHIKQIKIFCLIFRLLTFSQKDEWIMSVCGLDHEIWWPDDVLGAVSIYKQSFLGMGIPIIKIWRSWDCLIFVVGIPIPVRQHLYIEIGPGLLLYIYG